MGVNSYSNSRVEHLACNNNGSNNNMKIQAEIQMPPLEIHKVRLPPERTTLQKLRHRLSEIFFPDDPLHRFKNQTCLMKLLLALQYFFPIFQWAPHYNLSLLRSDIISGLTIASLAIPQGISYAKFANLPPILGLYSSFVPPLIYSLLGSSRHLGVGPVSIASLVMGSMLSETVSFSQDPILYLKLAFTATFFAGLFQSSLGILRLGFVIDFLSKATLVGFMAGAAIIVSLQQLKGLLGIVHFTNKMQITPVLISVFKQRDEVAISVFKILLHVSRPNTLVLGNIPGTPIFHSLNQYREALRIPSFVILAVESPIYFANSTYLQERILRWVREEEERVKANNESTLKCIILDMTAVTAIDTSGIDTLYELRKVLDKRSLQLVLANPVGNVMEKLHQSNILDSFGLKGVYLSVGEAVADISSSWKAQP
ncbi:Putative sulfate transporter 3.4 [Glycine soja]|uniref:Putative sulfate transporter 3.4 n=1 Tax=Glycine soja TaxID=3848 RepID=A0A0B2SSG8_GLYSO|nr:Putative sulfate transporter 3.4 [Glycine soja]